MAASGAPKPFIPIYPKKLPTVRKTSRAGRTASVVFKNLPESQSATTRLLNRFEVLKTSNQGSHPSFSAIFKFNRCFVYSRRA